MGAIECHVVPENKASVWGFFKVMRDVDAQFRNICRLESGEIVKTNFPRCSQ